MYCPHCRYEYEPWAEVCSDCGEPLVAGPPEPPPRPEPVHDERDLRDWVVAANVPNALVGRILKDQMEQAGIPVLMKRAQATDIAEFSHNDFAWHDLYVPRRYAQHARELAYSPGDARHLRPADDPEVERWADDGWTDEVDEEPAGDLLSGPAPPLAGGWYLIDSDQPRPVPAPAPAPPAEAALPGLGAYQRALDDRKSHRPPPPGPAPVVPFPGERLPERLPAPARNAPQPWTRSRIYRALMGLLFLAWTLPWLLQLWQYFRDAWAGLFR